MKITKTNIDGLIVIEPEIFLDDRGFFFESWNLNSFKKIMESIAEKNKLNIVSCNQV